MKSVITSLLFLSKSAFSSGGTWDYDHMSEWYHDYSMCAAQDESPINIETDNVIYDSHVCGSTFNWTIDWSVHSWKLNNNGHTIVLTPIEETTIDPDGDLDDTVIAEDGTAYSTLTLNENAIAKLPNYFLPEGSPHEEFCFHSMHFHWGLENDEGSEHTLDAVMYPMEVHFVHYSCQHAGLGTTLGQYPTHEDVLEKRENGEDTHELAVVGIFFELTDYDNPLFDAVLPDDTLENIQYPPDVTGTSSEEIIKNVYLQDIIPEEVFTDGYYAYEGSLTTPPCTDIVRWHVMNAKSYIGKAQIARFRELMFTANKTMAPNYREVQNNVNPVYACFEEYVEPDVITQAERTEHAIMWVYAVFILGLMIGMGVFCVRRSKREAAAVLTREESNKQKRERLASRSSIGGLHDMSRQSSHGSRRSSLHHERQQSTGGGH
mmetsp:Transcript_73008/g.65686  ORF Transcript_73008/g.65686 Transcript_73008/m.65686 type:complete len:433 (-) Transcript_73008:142-1440(-)